MSCLKTIHCLSWNLPVVLMDLVMMSPQIASPKGQVPAKKAASELRAPALGAALEAALGAKRGSALGVAAKKFGGAVKMTPKSLTTVVDRLCPGSPHP